MQEQLNDAGCMDSHQDWVLYISIQFSQVWKMVFFEMRKKIEPLKIFLQIVK